MIRRLKIILVFLSCILILGCKKESKVEITRIEISNQADIDFICENLPDSDTFSGTIVIVTEEVLDYKCLGQIKHVQGAFFLNGPGTSIAFRNIETLSGEETFNICDEAVDTIYFPALRSIGNNAGISISSFCNFSNVLHIPNIETIGAINVASPATNEARSGTFMGFDKVLEIISIYIDSNNGQEENIKIDGFSNLKKVLVEFSISQINKDFEVSEKSFNSLEEVGLLFRLVQSYDSLTHTDLTLEYLFPKLKYSENIELINFDPNEACYLKEYVESGDVKIGILNTTSNEFYNNEKLLELCE